MKVGDVLIARKSLGFWLRKRSPSQCPPPMETCIGEVRGCHLPISTAAVVCPRCSAVRQVPRVSTSGVILIPTFLPAHTPRETPHFPKTLTHHKALFTYQDSWHHAHRAPEPGSTVLPLPADAVPRALHASCVTVPLAYYSLLCVLSSLCLPSDVVPIPQSEAQVLPTR